MQGGLPKIWQPPPSYVSCLLLDGQSAEPEVAKRTGVPASLLVYDATRSHTNVVCTKVTTRSPKAKHYMQGQTSLIGRACTHTGARRTQGHMLRCAHTLACDARELNWPKMLVHQVQVMGL